MTHNRRYRIQEKYIAYHRVFLVSDDENKTAYLLHHQFDKVGSQMVLMDPSGTALITIRHIIDRHQTFDIYRADNNGHHNLLGVVRRIGRPWHHRFIIESIYGEHKIDRSGRLFSHRYEIMQDQQLVATINEEGGESDGLVSIEIAKDVDAMKDPFLLALAMIQQTL